MSRSYLNVEKAVQALPASFTLLAAVSGGRDSVCLLHALVSAKRGGRIVVAHIDHGLRKESVADAQFVAKLAADFGLACRSKRLNPPPSENLEAWGRRERYAFFSEVRMTEKLDLIVTAHHAHDEVETYLMRLLSNKEPRVLREADEVRQVSRPLLRVSRDDIERYIKQHELSYVEDQTNSDTGLLRNRVRLCALPYLQQEFPDFKVESLAERLRLLQQDFELLDGWAEGILTSHVSAGFGSRAWLQELRGVLDEYPDALRWRLLEIAFLEELGFRLGHAKCQQVLEFLNGNGRELQLEGFSLIRNEGGLILQWKSR